MESIDGLNLINGLLQKEQDISSDRGIVDLLHCLQDWQCNQ
ncbi:hypothetical protein ASZ90_020004 [hydrocarbon metagenome]|uniref:Uncharacterized protein n=1 Tax=hydrocarbon metagenome TaxID=938273 RepID=A0A0W8E1W1_9ZZZZ